MQEEEHVNKYNSMKNLHEEFNQGENIYKRESLQMIAKNLDFFECLKT